MVHIKGIPSEVSVAKGLLVDIAITSQFTCILLRLLKPTNQTTVPKGYGLGLE